MEMERLFTDTLQKLKELARRQGGVLEEDQLFHAFEEIGFSIEESNQELIYDYLKKSGIGIGETLEPEEYLSKEESDYFKQYLQEVNRLEKLSEGEKEAVTLSAMAGDKDARNKLIEIYLPYVAEVARLYAGQGVYLEDLIGEGNVALAMGVGMLGCLEKASEVQGMLGSMMMEAMEALIKENMDLQQSDQRLAGKVNRIAGMAKELAVELGRKVTPEELAEEKGISLKTIRDAVKISGNKIEDLDTAFRE